MLNQAGTAPSYPRVVNGPQQRRFLAAGWFDAVAMSLGGMAPTVGMNLNPQQPAQHVGRAVPLVFALCTVLLLLVAWCFAHLAARHPGAGSAYTFVGATLGRRAGLVAGNSGLPSRFWHLPFPVCAGCAGAALLGGKRERQRRCDSKSGNSAPRLLPPMPPPPSPFFFRNPSALLCRH